MIKNVINNKKLFENQRLKNNIKNLNIIEINNEINNKKLSLRKKKLNKFLNEKRFKKIEENNFLNDEKKALKLNNENDKIKFINIIKQIEKKSNDNDNEELINDLEIVYYSLNSIKDELDNLNIFNEIINEGLIKILHEKIIPKFLNNLHIIYLVTLILSVFIEFIKYFLYDDECKDDFEKMQNYFLSQNNYIQNYKLIFDKYFEDKNILNNLCIFFSIIIFENKTNSNIILNQNFLNVIIDNFSFSFDEKNIFCVENQLQFISNFEDRNFIEKNCDLCLKIQNIIIKLIFQFQDLIKKKENLQLLSYIIKINGNLSYSSNETIINNFFDYDIIQFILDLELDEKCNFLDFVLIFFGNLLCNEINIVKKLYNYGIYNMLINIIKNNKYSNEEREKSFWCLNNFHIETEICIEIFKNIENVNFLFEFMKFNNKYNFSIFHEINITLYLFAKNLPEKFVLILISQYNLINIAINKYNIYINNNVLSYYEFIILSSDLTNIVNLLILNPKENIKNESLNILVNLNVEELIDKIILTCYSIDIENLHEDDQQKIKSLSYLAENIKEKLKKFNDNY